MIGSNVQLLAVPQRQPKKYRSLYDWTERAVGGLCGSGSKLAIVLGSNYMGDQLNVISILGR